MFQLYLTTIDCHLFLVVVKWSFHLNFDLYVQKHVFQLVNLYNIHNTLSALSVLTMINVHCLLLWMYNLESCVTVTFTQQYFVVTCEIWQQISVWNKCC